MKAKKLAVVAALAAALILAQILFGGKKGKKIESKAVPTTAIASPPAATAGGSVAEATRPSAFLPEDAQVIYLGRPGFEPAIRLERDNATGWVIGSMRRAPAETGKVERLLRDLFLSESRPVHATDTVSPVGLDAGEGVRITIAMRNGSVWERLVGLRPDGEYARAFIRQPDGETVLVDADIRGDLGLWKNQPVVIPESAAWLERQVFRFNPGKVKSITANYPDHRIGFAKGSEGAWQASGYVPGARWNLQGVVDWLADLSELRVSGVDEIEELPGIEHLLHTLTVTLENGTEKILKAVPSPAGEGFLVSVSDYPHIVFHLPEWRFKKYFLRMHSLFPDAVPLFASGDVLSLDIRRGGENLKITRPGPAWSAATQPYPLKPGRLERLTRFLASLQPEDYATPDFKSIRPTYGAPMVDVTLASGNAIQYRLAGRHPVFPWRYVIVNNSTILSVSDTTAAAMFPDFADILDLGKAFPETEAAFPETVTLRDAQGTRIVTLRKNADGGWLAETDRASRALAEEETAKTIRGLLDWDVAGFFDDTDTAQTKVLYTLTVGGTGETGKTIQVLLPRERDIPFITENDAGFLISRQDFFAWENAMREIGRNLNATAEAAADAAHDAGEQRQENAHDDSHDTEEQGETATEPERGKQSPAMERDEPGQDGRKGDAPGQDAPRDAGASDQPDVEKAGVSGGELREALQQDIMDKDVAPAIEASVSTGHAVPEIVGATGNGEGATNADASEDTLRNSDDKPLQEPRSAPPDRSVAETALRKEPATGGDSNAEQTKGTTAGRLPHNAPGTEGDNRNDAPAEVEKKQADAL